MTTQDYRRKSPLSIFLHYFKNHKLLFAVDITSASLICAVDLAFPLVTRKALYDLLPNNLYGTFFALMVLMAVFYLLRTGLNYVVSFFGHLFGVRVEADIRADLFRHMQELSYDFYDKNRTGQLMSRLTSDLFDLTEFAHHGPEDLLTSTVTIIGALIVMGSIQWQLALVVGIMIPIFLIVVMLMRKNMSRASTALKQKTGHINSEIETSISGIRTAKAFANEAVENARFTAANELFKDSKKGFYRAMSMFHSSMELLLTSLNVIVIGLGGWLIMDGKMDYRDLLTFTMYISTFTSPMRKLSNFSETFAKSIAGLKRFVDLMRMSPSVQDSENAKPLENVKGQIRLENVTFAYEENLEVIRDLSLTVAPGETLAIVGPSGGGKTTLCQLIPRFYDVDSGSICIDGQDVRTVTQRSLHENIGIVQQDVFLFAGTIADNIRYGKPDATDEEVIAAAKKAEIYEDILAMPHGLETYVGERGTLLSGGQKQRVAIARIFLMDPPILILDEATSALDSITESKIQRAFDALSLGRTTVIIAHRLSTIRSADRIISIADGTITQAGTHEELLAQGGLYADLYNTQHS